MIPPVERNDSGYRIFTQKHLDCLRLAQTIYASEYPGRDLRASSNEIIQMLSHAGHSHMEILRMFIEQDGGKTRGLKKILDTPREDEDIFTAADHWLSTLKAQERQVKQVIKTIDGLTKAKA